MTWQVTVGGTSHRSSRLTIAEASALEARLGVPFHRIDPTASAHHALALAAAFGIDPAGVRLDQFCWIDDDIPDYFRDGIPEGDASVEDRWLCQLCLPPFGFTPRQVREEFTIRDVQLLVNAAASRE